MTHRFHVEFRGLNYEYGLTGEVAHERCIETGVEKIYKRRSPNVWMRKTVASQSLHDVVGDSELIALLEGLFARTKESA